MRKLCLLTIYTSRYDESLWKRLDLSGRVLPQGVLGNCVLNRGCEYLRLSTTEVSVLFLPDIKKSNKQ